ncbi:MAG TPA: Smr/MutS family protein [Novosphingobium sp.]|nr:Smr/MutS family protein [Novosphingobium sp.]
MARTLDGTWERKLAKAQIAPDFEIDLHGDTLDRAYTRLMASLGQAIANEARLVLVIAGKARPHDDHASRGQRRGAIRAKLLDWLAASPHAGRIAAVRPAAQRHGGAGAVYVVLRRPPAR